MLPKKLKIGAHLRIISPSRSLSLISKENRQIANERFARMGLTVSFGKHVEEMDEFNSSPIDSRVEDLHDAFSDPSVDAVMTVIGGFNSNQLLRYIDWGLIEKNPKIFCGYSDITALQNALYAKTGLVTYSAPHYSTFGMKEGFEFTLDYFNQCLFDSKPFQLKPSAQWSDDAWYSNQDNRKYMENPGYQVIQEGAAEGTVVGANLCTFNLLHGTEYMPSLNNSILCIEDDEMSGPMTHAMVDRDLQSILQQPGAEGIKGVLIGRFQRNSEMTIDKIKKIISTKRELSNVPVISGLDFGHTSPYLTLPIGGTIRMEAKENRVQITVLEH